MILLLTLLAVCICYAYKKPRKARQTRTTAPPAAMAFTTAKDAQRARKDAQKAAQARRDIEYYTAALALYTEERERARRAIQAITDAQRGKNRLAGLVDDPAAFIEAFYNDFDAPKVDEKALDKLKRQYLTAQQRIYTAESRIEKARFILNETEGKI